MKLVGADICPSTKAAQDRVLNKISLAGLFLFWSPEIEKITVNTDFIGPARSFGFTDLLCSRAGYGQALVIENGAG